MPDIGRRQFRGLDVRVIHTGQGAPMLFLHGASGLPPWNSFFETLSSRYDLLVPEHPGFGASADAPWIRSVADVALHYLDLLDDLDLRGVHLVGHSLGGWIAAELAVRTCSRLASLTLIAPAGARLKGVPFGDNFIWGVEEGVRNLFHDPAFAEQMLSRTLTDDEADLALNSRFMAARLGWEPRWVNPALTRWMHRIQVPTLILWGDDDQLFPCSYASVWTENIPGSTRQIIPGCGHLPHIEKAAETADRIVTFLGGNAP